MEGWIKLHRKLLEWEWYSDINISRLFIHILLKANFKTKKWQGKVIEQGSFITSKEGLANETGLSIQQVRTGLKKLEQTGEIITKATNKNTLIKVVNYSTLQDLSSIDQQTNNNQVTDKEQANNLQITNEEQANNNHTTSKQQTNNKEITTTKECKEVKNDNKEKKSKNIPLNPPKGEKGITLELEEIRLKYNFSPKLSEAVDDFIQYKKERRESYKPIGLNSLLKQISNKVEKHGEDDVTDLINLCMASNYKSIIFKMLEEKRGVTNGGYGKSQYKPNEDRGIPKSNQEDPYSKIESISL